MGKFVGSLPCSIQAWFLSATKLQKSVVSTFQKFCRLYRECMSHLPWPRGSQSQQGASTAPAGQTFISGCLAVTTTTKRSEEMTSEFSLSDVSSISLVPFSGE